MAPMSTFCGRIYCVTTTTIFKFDISEYIYKVKYDLVQQSLEIVLLINGSSFDELHRDKPALQSISYRYFFNLQG